MERNRNIDIMKILLVIGMIIGHCIQLVGKYSVKTTNISNLINLITFSGFIFCFGNSVSIAYLNKNKEIVIKKMIKNIIELLIVFYISGIGYEFFIVKNFSLLKLKKILTLSHIPGYSEFLISFLIFNIFTIIFFITTLMLTFIPYRFINNVKLGLIIGSDKFVCFPVIQYSGYYILGMYFQKNQLYLI